MKAYTANARLNEYEYRQGRTALRSWPRVIDLGLTLKCNLNCVMCFSRLMPPIDLDLDCLEKAIPYLDYCEQITWNDAGELFASSRTREFLRLVKQYHPPKSYVSTNFLLIDRHLDDILDSGLTHISVSIDAATRETYEAIRVGARWDKLIANLELMQKKKAERGTVWPRLTFVFVAMQRNLPELPAFVDFAAHYGAESIEVLKMLPTPKGLEKCEQPSFEAERAAYKEALRRAQALGIQIQHTFFSNADLLDEIARETPEPPSAGLSPSATATASAAAIPPVALERLHRRQFDPASGNVPVCPSPWREFLIQTDGRVRACCFSPAIMGDLHHQTLPEIWNGPAYQAFRQRLVLRDFSTCIACPYLAKIGAAAVRPIGGDAGTELQAAEQNPWIEGYLHDVVWMVDYLRRVRHGRLRTAFQQLGTALKTAVRLTWRSGLAKPALARAWNEQRRVNRMLYERLRRLREDLELVCEAIRTGALQQKPESGVWPAALAPDGAQDPVDALFYSARIVRHETPDRLRAGEHVMVPVAVQNTSAVVWPTEGTYSVKLAYSWLYDNGAMYHLDGLRTLLVPPPRPGEIVELQANLRAPDRPGWYILVWDLVYDPYAWFKDRGSLPVEVDVLVE
ncbi:MAG: SPASM domain-containing protein [Candidatus Sumerlaeia bacterium]|nr:SPASM domain-containing protein [Candidatus Sumerlaeia bacterium]